MGPWLLDFRSLRLSIFWKPQCSSNHYTKDVITQYRILDNAKLKKRNFSGDTKGWKSEVRTALLKYKRIQLYFWTIKLFSLRTFLKRPEEIVHPSFNRLIYFLSANVKFHSQVHFVFKGLRCCPD